jgi:5-methylcytosine-specific restriction endonuclease McrA
MYTEDKIESLTVEEDPIKDEEGFLLVRCKSCREYFRPLNKDLVRRKMALNRFDLGESNLYCSEACKSKCATYGRRVNFKGFETKSRYSDARTTAWSKMVLERDKYTCQKCGCKNNLSAHHIIPVAENFILSADLDNGITYCDICHRESHIEIDGCGYSELGSLCK